MPEFGYGRKKADDAVKLKDTLTNLERYLTDCLTEKAIYVAHGNQ
jgi:hypothetical protein